LIADTIDLGENTVSQ